MKQYLVDYRLGCVLGVTMFLGALPGARVAIRLGKQWLRQIFLAAVWALGIMTLLYDVLARSRVRYAARRQMIAF
jgi:uncharacterized membrane protein YfcA